MTISVISSTLASAYVSSPLGPRSVQENTADAKGQPVGTAAASGNDAPAADSQRGSTNFQARPAPGAQAADQGESDDPISRTIKMLEQQLRQVQLQIQRLTASSIPQEQKAGQLQALSGEAATLQAQIAALRQQQAEAAKGSITA
ncbi:hypothetical protein CAL26_06115 [Bordetella genomosp. 9]|uniref:FlxA-like protein n=1 Tax=Bordetella genomosp. 9 TaxID=1416803 RepID=A0A261RDK7_9BORD|nr:FlxA-like family protein [Bordetella genomosp. 9]OZI23055.1 hypothetical protein CAL26_06115 [Bordetella genomosp. 9]